MNQWDLLTAEGGDRSGPRVLFSTPEARGLVVDLAKDQELGDHQVRERALVQVLRGSVMCTSGADNATCAEGTLVVFDPGELIPCERSNRRSCSSCWRRGRPRDTMTPPRAKIRTSCPFMRHNRRVTPVLHS